MNNEINQALMEVFRYLAPELVLGAAACILFLGATFRADRHLWAAFSLIALIGSGVALVYSPHPDQTVGTVYAATSSCSTAASILRATPDSLIARGGTPRPFA